MWSHVFDKSSCQYFFINLAFAALVNRDSAIAHNMYFERAKSTLNASSFRAAVKLGLQYELLLGRAVLVPCAFYNIGITRVNPDDPWRMNAIQFGADLRYAF